MVLLVGKLCWGLGLGWGFGGWLPGTLRSPRGTWGPPEEKEEEERSRVTGTGIAPPGSAPAPPLPTGGRLPRGVRGN